MDNMDNRILTCTKRNLNIELKKYVEDNYIYSNCNIYALIVLIVQK